MTTEWIPKRLISNRSRSATPAIAGRPNAAPWVSVKPSAARRWATTLSHCSGGIMGVGWTTGAPGSQPAWTRDAARSGEGAKRLGPGGGGANNPGKGTTRRGATRRDPARRDVDGVHPAVRRRVALRGDRGVARGAARAAQRGARGEVHPL